LTSCVKSEYDEPAINNIDPNLTVTNSILDLRNMATSVPQLIMTDIIIKGIIIADDKSGSFYKEMVIQDSTGGLSILLDVSNFNSNYPIGRRVFIKCKGLYVAKDPDGIVEIGAVSNGEIGRIPAGIVQQYIVPGMWGLELPYTDQSLDYVNGHLDELCQTLIRMSSLEFDLADAGIAYAGDPSSSGDNNRTLNDCSGNSMIVYTSAYASFANATAPFLNGTVSGVLKIYRGDGELVLRDLDDVQMSQVRCDGSTGNPVLVDLDSIRSFDPGTAVATLPGDWMIRVVVTSDNTTNMTNNQNMFCQDQTAGIQIRFSAPHSFALGTELEIRVGGMELSNYRGVLQINNVPLAVATVVSPPTLTVTPRLATLSAMNTNYTAWESQLVKVDNVTLSGNSTLSGSLTMDDGSGSTLVLYTSSSASFSGNATPTGPVSVTGLLIEYNGTKEIIIRNPGDIQ
jgi:DNA/RNA endonuclease YhcR with UshA esterase domain